MEEIEWQIMLEQFVASDVIVKDEIIDIDTSEIFTLYGAFGLLSTLSLSLS
jgi:hypothetical protein